MGPSILSIMYLFVLIYVKKIENKKKKLARMSGWPKLFTEMFVVLDRIAKPEATNITARNRVLEQPLNVARPSSSDIGSFNRWSGSASSSISQIIFSDGFSISTDSCFFFFPFFFLFFLACSSAVIFVVS